LELNNSGTPNYFLATFLAPESQEGLMETCLTDWWTTAIMNSCQKNSRENCRGWGREKDLIVYPLDIHPWKLGLKSHLKISAERCSS